MKKIFLLIIVLIFVGQKSIVAMELPRTLDVQPLKELTARTIANQRHLLPDIEGIDHISKGAIAVEAKSAELAYDALLTSLHSPYTPELLSIVVQYVLEKIPVHTLYAKHNNLPEAILPQSINHEITEEQKGDVHEALTPILCQSSDIGKIQQRHFPRSQKELNQLNFEQLIYLLLATRTPSAYSQSDYITHHHWTLYHKCFLTLPPNMQRTLKNRSLKMCREYLCGKKYARPVAAANLLTLFTLYTILYHYVYHLKSLIGISAKHIGTIPTGTIIAIITLVLVATPTGILTNWCADKEIQRKFHKPSCL